VLAKCTEEKPKPSNIFSKLNLKSMEIPNGITSPKNRITTKDKPIVKLTPKLENMMSPVAKSLSRKTSVHKLEKTPVRKSTEFGIHKTNFINIIQSKNQMGLLGNKIKMNLARKPISQLDIRNLDYKTESKYGSQSNIYMNNTDFNILNKIKKPENQANGVFNKKNILNFKSESSGNKKPAFFKKDKIPKEELLNKLKRLSKNLTQKKQKKVEEKPKMICSVIQKTNDTNKNSYIKPAINTTKKDFISNKIKNELLNLNNHSVQNENKIESVQTLTLISPKAQESLNLNLFEPTSIQNKIINYNTEIRNPIRKIHSVNHSLLFNRETERKEQLSLNTSLMNSKRLDETKLNYLTEQKFTRQKKKETQSLMNVDLLKGILTKQKDTRKPFHLQTNQRQYFSLRNGTKTKFNEYNLSKQNSMTNNRIEVEEKQENKSQKVMVSSIIKTNINNVDTQNKLSKIKSLGNIKTIDSELKLKKKKKNEMKNNFRDLKDSCSIIDQKSRNNQGMPKKTENTKESRVNRFENLPTISHFIKKKPNKSILKKYKSARYLRR
jgi:hypothetical protein